MKIICLPEDVEEFIKDIAKQVSVNFDVYLGGGYIRDTYCGLTPKDVDIFFVPKKEQEVPLQVGYIPTRCYINYNKNVSSMTHTEDMDARGVSQVIGLFNSKLSTTEVQFIVYKKPLTQEELAKDFDMNLNQCTWCPVKDKFYLSPEFISAHKDKELRCLHKYNTLRTYERYERMERRFPSYEVIGKPLVEDLPQITQLSVAMGTFKDTSHAGSMVGEE